MDQNLQKYAVAVGTGKRDRVWFGIMAQNKPKAITHARKAFESRVRPLAPNETLLVEVRT